MSWAKKHFGTQNNSQQKIGFNDKNSILIQKVIPNFLKKLKLKKKWEM